MSQPAQASLTRLEEIVGAANVLTDPAELYARQADGMVPSAVIRPADAAQIAEVIRFAAREQLALIPCGGCTKLGIGSPPSRYDFALDLTRMDRVLAYDPRDLTLGVEPGARIADLLKVLAEQKQFLPLAVPFSDRATIGGIVATNSSSPLRHSYGAVRDFCLGMEFVTGDGTPAKSGGRVVKNVTGYDLHKLLVGSLGTLAVITRVNFRTFPLLAASGTFVASFPDAETSVGFCRAVAQSVLTPQMVEVADPGAAHILFSAEASARITPSRWSVIITASGQPAAVDRHAWELGHLASAANADEFIVLSDAEHSSILTRIREFPRLVLEAAPSAMIFRIGVLPTPMSPLLVRLGQVAAQNHVDFAALARASGVVYAAFLPEEGGTTPFAALAKPSAEVFQACSEFSAPVMLEWCPVEVKRATGGVWGPARPDFALMQRVKTVFDPQNVLSPNRFAGGSEPMTDQTTRTEHKIGPAQGSGFSGTDRPAYDDYALCVHCGLCLNHCPTYKLWGLEADSPRGRIRQMVLVDQGRLALGESFVRHIDLCLDCRACETACPSGVEYGKLVEAARAQIEQNYRRPFFSRLTRDFVFRRLLPYPKRIATVARVLRIYQRSGLQSLARATGILRVLGLADRERLLPPIDRKFFFSQLGKTYPAVGPRRARVALFAGCVAQVSFSALHDATIRVLTANGCEVIVPQGQTCCGALAAHAGVRDTARSLARTNLDVFLRDDFDAVITNAAGCGSTLKEYEQLFGAGTEEHSKAHAFREKMRDVTEFLADLGMTARLGILPLRVTYQDSCHLLHGQKIRDAPRKLLRAIPGVELVEMAMADYCCGSAGSYNVTETQASLDILAEKMKHARATNAPVIVTANPGCLLQMRAGAEIHSTGQEVLHVIELLDRALVKNSQRRSHGEPY